ncbi:uncharacterized protein J4E88_003402 [Alternaria novae-zelandiae]|uniref:uncharacterized protein n=1 Tax=Alternaria novae-zelandiae TaxID=430562 RepID=UPI0020C47DAA|nr:uncharacterized protein J4E88_003402 [Alternaria novae-zelandiae]KAI4687811.1 hypothetical protein J4E88_003402 [Alternaria novae-zelandiae]
MTHSVSQAIVQEWNKSLGEDVPKRSNLHARAKALFLLWEDASPDRRSDSEDLKLLLEQRYRFETESFEIPLEDPQTVLHDRVLAFIDSIDSSSGLALVYYSGHGNIKNGSQFWLPLEVLATPSGMSAEDSSFRRALTGTLSEAHGEYVYIDQLRKSIYRRLGNPFDPVYVNLSRGNDRSSIAILPLERVDIDLLIKTSMDASNQQGLKQWADRAPRQIKAFKFLLPEGRSGDSNLNHMTVQVDVANLNDLENISSWTKKLPSFVKDITIPGLLQSTKAKTSNERLNEFCQVFNKNKRLHTDLGTRDGRYRRIVVLPLKWLKDGFINTSMISQELRKFSDAFRTNFDNCEVKPIFEIPAGEAPLSKVVKRIIQILDDLSSSDLLIVAYNGHGSKTNHQSGQCVLSSAPRGGNGSEINWNAVQPHLYEATCDVVQVLDCCYAGSAIKAAPQGRNEILAACDREVSTPCGSDSYMERFTAILLELIQEAKPFSLSTVQERIKIATDHRNVDIEQQKAQGQHATSVLELIPLPVYQLIPDSSSSITLRPKTLAIDYEYDGMTGHRSSQDGNEFVGWAYAKIAVCSGDDGKDWKNMRVAKLFNGEEMLGELQRDT